MIKPCHFFEIFLIKSDFLGLYDKDLDLFMSLMNFFGVFDYLFS